MFLNRLRKVQKGEREQKGNDKKRLYELIEKYKSQTLELNEAHELEGILEREQEKREQKGDSTGVIYIGIILLGVTTYIAKMVMIKND